ncbi:DUF2976 domain-containing protein [Aliikangiella maris]|uniref:DUF2976 domain-containing protein n=2 Tax=Aliikangiella maris TaxID=3162458 RepID=A0ABV3MTT6_9GAMM
MKKITKLHTWIKAAVATMVISLSSIVSAEMPVVEANSDGVGATGGLWAFLTGWFKDIMVWIPLGLMSVATIWVAWSLLQKVLNERQQEKPNWGSVLSHAAGCVLLLVVTVFLGNATINVWA